MADDDLGTLFPSVPQPPMRSDHLGPGSQPQPVTAVIDNRTTLPDGTIREIIQARWTEIAGLQLAAPSQFSLYGGQNTFGSMLAKMPFRTPTTPIEEIVLARTIADTDDDVAATLGMMIAVGFGEAMQNQHKDEDTLEFFNQITAPTGMNLEDVFEELYREYLIAGSLTTLTMFYRKRMSYFPLKSDQAVTAQLQVPSVGVLPAENIRVISNDVLGNGTLAFYAADYNLKWWLEEFFNPKTPELRKSQMRQDEPVMAALFTGKVQIPFNDGDPFSRGLTLYTLNERMVHRTTMPKGSMPYPRPPLTRNFALVEAKRLLNIMDYALLQGGTNYIVIAKQGSDELPAQQPEIDNLTEMVRHASRSGVLVGDHRLSVEIVTPQLEELLNPAKRRLLGRKIAMGLLRQTEQNTPDAGNQGATNEMELLGRVVSADRRKLVRHVQATIYDETATRNRSTFTEGAPKIWFPKIVLSGAKDFWANVIQARDRGDIPRRWAVEALGYDYDAGLAEREREIARGDDDILAPASVPFSNPAAGPQDNGPGRPIGTSTNNGKGKDTPGQGRDSFAPNHVIKRTAGETIRALVEDNEVSYIGETTFALMAEYPDAEVGYVTSAERECIELNQTIRRGSSVYLPVNQDLHCNDELRTVRLTEGLAVVVGQKVGDEALVARALRFAEPKFDLLKASEYAIRWGFLTAPLVEVAKQPKRCKNCGNEMPGYGPMTPICMNCGHDNSPQGSNPDGGGSPSPGPTITAEEDSLPLTDDDVAKLTTAFTNAARALPTPQITVVRDAPEPTWEDELARDFSQAQRTAAAKEGAALPDGHFPIYNQGDIDAAEHLIGRYKGQYDAKAHVIKRAKALNLTLPASWTS